MDAMINKMRTDWCVVAADRKACGQWTADDEQMIAAAVKSAIDSGDRTTITLWARWLADLSASTIALKAIVTCVDLRMRDAARKHRDAQKKAA